MKTLDPAQRRALRAQAHHLHPVVSIGHHGLTPAVLHEIDVNLLAHELVKVRVFEDDRGAREELLRKACDALDAAPVQHVGKVLVLYREAPPDEEASARAPVKAANPKRPPRTGAGGAERPSRSPRPETRSRGQSGAAPGTSKPVRRRPSQPLTAGKAREMVGTARRKPDNGGPAAQRRSPAAGPGASAQRRSATGGHGTAQQRRSPAGGHGIAQQRRSPAAGHGTAQQQRSPAATPGAGRQRRSAAAPAVAAPKSAPRQRRRRG